MIKDRQLIESIRRSLLLHRDNILIAGIVGSQEHDLDILVVLKDADWDTYLRIYSSLARLPDATFFPTFRLQAFVEIYNKTQRRLVHFLLYHSLDSLFEVEHEFCRYTMIDSVVPFIGDRNFVLPLNTKPKVPGINYYINLLHETALFLASKAFPLDICALEAQYKILYCLKYAFYEHRYFEEPKLKPTEIISKVFLTNKSDIGQRAIDLYNSVSKWEDVEESTMFDSFRETYDLLILLEKGCVR